MKYSLKALQGPCIGAVATLAVADYVKDSFIRGKHGSDVANCTKCDSDFISNHGPGLPPLSKPGPKILFLGTGSSTGCPKPICSLLFPPIKVASSSDNTDSSTSTLIKLQNEMKSKCKVSKLASMGNPLYNKNYRNNPSILISHSNDNLGGEYKNVIVDVGKTFREGAIRWMPLHSIYSVDAIVLTHEHADAILGLDDLRGFQRSPYMLKSNISDNEVKNKNESSSSLQVFTSIKCFEKVKQQFDYLVPKDSQSSSSNNSCCNGGKHDERQHGNDDGAKKNILPVVERAVASLQFKIIHHFQPFIAGGLKMIPLPVMHGEDFVSNGYAFSIQSEKERDEDGSRKTTNVVYLSDISRMIPETEKFILNELPQPTDILIIDSLLMNDEHPVHFSLKKALEVVQKIKPTRTFIVGMNCDDFPEHDEANEMLKRLHPHVQLAHDGLVVECF